MSPQNVLFLRQSHYVAQIGFKLMFILLAQPLDVFQQARSLKVVFFLR